MTTEIRATWDAAYINDLPDSAFAFIEDGGSKDDDGKTTPRSLRHFPHHDSGGAPDRAHVANAAARIPQSDVSAEGKAKAEAHIEAHEKEMGMGEDDGADADDKKSAPHYQRRSFAMDIKVEQRHRSAPPTLIGHAAVFDQVADLGYMRERIAPGAFSRSLREGGPVYALWNHNPDYIIASTKNGSLRLSEDKTGLVAEMDPMDTPTIRDLVIKPMQDGMVDKMSFGFETVRDEMDTDKQGPVRVLRDVNLFDVSPVTFPAYEGTDIQSRLATIMGRVERDLPLTESDEKMVRLLISMLTRSLPNLQEVAQKEASASAGVLEAEVRARRLQMLKIQIEGNLHA